MKSVAVFFVAILCVGVLSSISYAGGHSDFRIKITIDSQTIYSNQGHYRHRISPIKSRQHRFYRHQQRRASSQQQGVEPLVKLNMNISCTNPINGVLLYTVSYSSYGNEFHRLKIYPTGAENVIRIKKLPLFRNVCSQ